MQAYAYTIKYRLARPHGTCHDSRDLLPGRRRNPRLSYAENVTVASEMQNVEGSEASDPPVAKIISHDIIHIPPSSIQIERITFIKVLEAPDIQTGWQGSAAT